MICYGRGRKEKVGGGERWLPKSLMVVPFYSSLADKPVEKRLITRLVTISTYLSILRNRAVCSAWKLLIK